MNELAFIWDQHTSESVSLKAIGKGEILRRDLSLTKAAAYEILVTPKLDVIYLTPSSLN